MTTAARVPRWRLALFAGGDFGFNLFWQSSTLYLLFHYTEVLAMPVATAATIFLAAWVWDGIASFAVGVAVDRGRWAGRYRTIMVAGALPLALAFTLAWVPVAHWGWALAAQLAFRTVYAALNIPYTAMSSRVSLASDDRAFVSGLRMLAGTLAAVTVASGMIPLGRWFAGSGNANGLAAAAFVIGAVGAGLIALVGATFRDMAPAEQAPRPPLGQALRDLAANRAYATLMLAMAAMIVGVTMFDRSVLYYFKYALSDEEAGRLALTGMAAVSGLAVPLWMVLARRAGARAVWFGAVAACCAGFGLFVAVDVSAAGATQGFLLGMQAAIVGLHFAFWAMLPDTVEWGQRRTGRRVEGVAFGLAALVQRVAIGIATALLGLGLAGGGSPATLRMTIAIVPLGLLIAAGAAMAFSPLRRGAHDRAVAQL